VTNILLAHVYFFGKVPQQFRGMENGLKQYQQLQSATARYQWMNEESVDLSLCSLAFNQHDRTQVKLVSTLDFGC
jgi:hypothetical protein